MYRLTKPDGSKWLRSVTGKWIPLTAASMTREQVIADFNAFEQSGISYTENEVKVENSSQIV